MIRAVMYMSLMLPLWLPLQGFKGLPIFYVAITDYRKFNIWDAGVPSKALVLILWMIYQLISKLKRGRGDNILSYEPVFFPLIFFRKVG